MKKIYRQGAKLSYHDPYIASLTLEGKRFRSQPLTKAYLESKDLILVLVDHSDFKKEFILHNSALIVDTRNLIGKKSSKVWKI